MKYTKKLTFGMVALNAVCAIIWGILTIMDIEARNEIQILIMHAFCAAIWLTASVLNLIRYKKEKNQEK